MFLSQQVQQVLGPYKYSLHSGQMWSVPDATIEVGCPGQLCVRGRAKILGYVYWDRRTYKIFGGSIVLGPTKY